MCFACACMYLTSSSLPVHVQEGRNSCNSIGLDWFLRRSYKVMQFQNKESVGKILSHPYLPLLLHKALPLYPALATAALAASV